MNKWVVVLMLVLLGAGGGVVYGVSRVAGHYLGSDAKVKAQATAQCQKTGVAHAVMIQNNVVVPKHTYASVCDTLTITNTDDRIRLLAFGPHENHQVYDGVSEKQLTQGEALTITLNRTGTYEFHDHIGDVAQGDFTVAQ